MPHKKCPLLPCGDRVVVRRDAIEQRGKVVLPEAALPESGRVVAVSPDVGDVRVGDHVVFKRLVATTVTVGERPWLLLKESDLLARVE